MEIREAKPEDLDDIVGMWETFMKYHKDVVMNLEQRLSRFIRMKRHANHMFRDFMAERIADKKALVLIAFDNGEPAGYCMSMIKDNIPVYEVDKIGYISDIYVPLRHRSKGISTRFKDMSIEWFRKKGMGYATIQGFVQNKIPLQIYRKWGFFDEHVRLIKKI